MIVLKRPTNVVNNNYPNTSIGNARQRAAVEISNTTSSFNCTIHIIDRITQASCR